MLSTSATATAVAVDEDVQSHYLGCLARYDAEDYEEAAVCLAEVYAELVAIDPRTRTDLYYVLADGALARQAAAAIEGDLRHLCEARALVDDYLGRGGPRERVRFRRKVQRLRSELNKQLTEAVSGEVSVEEACAEASESTADPGVEPEPPTEGGEPTTRADESGEGSTQGEGTSSGATSPKRPPPPASAVPKPKPRPKPKKARTLRSQPSTSLADAGFATTIAGVGLLGAGTTLALVELRCVDGPPRCADATPPALGDAGLALVGVGASAAITGLLLRWVDHRRLRRASAETKRSRLAP